MILKFKKKFINNKLYLTTNPKEKKIIRYDWKKGLIKINFDEYINWLTKSYKLSKKIRKILNISTSNFITKKELLVIIKNEKNNK